MFTLRMPASVLAILTASVPRDGRDLVSRGTVVHRGRTMAVANAEVRNEDGKQVALATGSAMILPSRPASLAGVAWD